MSTHIHTIGLLFSHAPDRQLLVDFLVEGGYRVRAPRLNRVQPEHWDDVSLILADEVAAWRYREVLLGLKNRSEAIFLPLLVATSPTTPVAPWLEAGFDDVIRLPVSKAELHTRLSTFLRLREQSLELARRSEEMFRALVEQSLVGVYLFTDRFLYVNEALARIFGYRPEEVMERLTPLDLTHPDDHPLVMERVRKRLSGEVEAERYTLRGVRKDGSTIYCEVFGRRITYQGQPAILGTLIDITDRVQASIRQAQLQEALQRQAAELEQRVAERTADLEEFVYSVSHDLRAPLRAMQGFAQVLLEDYADHLDAMGQEYARRIVEAGERMDTLIQDLLTYSRLNQVEIHVTRVDLRRVVQEALAQLQEESPARNARVTIEEPLPVVLAHYTTLLQVVLNLLSNACKFVAPG
ncbi:MAG: PAS domain-containing sensor histidine kinase, partial [Nitrospinota bacterium]